MTERDKFEYVLKVLFSCKTLDQWRWVYQWAMRVLDEDSRRAMRLNLRAEVTYFMAPHNRFS